MKNPRLYKFRLKYPDGSFAKTILLSSKEAKVQMKRTDIVLTTDEWVPRKKPQKKLEQLGLFT